MPIRSLVGTLVSALPPSLSARVDRVRGSGTEFGGPLNGQQGRQEIVRDLFSTAFDFVVETGTFRGESTAFLASLCDCLVYSVEANPRYFHFSRLRHKKHPRISVHLGDSRAFLGSLADAGVGFFYLDAHWDEDLPLWDELRIIGKKWDRFVIMIDDFQVPGDSGYAFDDYGPDKRLVHDLLPEVPGVSVYCPAIPSHRETGHRRGCAVISRGVSIDSDLLRPI